MIYKNLYSFFIILCFPLFGNAQVMMSSSPTSIVNNKHNLSVSGRGSIKSFGESEICIFCHTDHISNPVAPLWNRNTSGINYTLYNSSTMQALPGQPDGSSILCLSCHDGTIALGNIISRAAPISFGATSRMPSTSNLSTDLRNDHPISFVYNSALSAADGQLNNPGFVNPAISLENEKIQCTSCHDPHKSTNPDFLVVTSQNSNLCNNCHKKPDWTSSIHNTSVKTWNGINPNPWPYTPWPTVAQNACENCHNPHNSGGIPRLLKYQPEENNCFDCHNANVASKNIQSEFTKTYKHNVYGYNGIHDPVESAIPFDKHVECIDCHSPHATKSQSAMAPFVKGANYGLIGVNQSGKEVRNVSYEYEVCYRCHSSRPATPSTTARQIAQNNVLLEFAPGNPSYHSVAAEGVNSSVPSLIAPLTVLSRIYCTDCHGNNSSSGPKGPHGSIYPQILKAQYVRTDNSPESSSSYVLCYNCHSRTSILSNSSFKEHSKHIVDQKTSCNVCHDPHGISSTQGTSMNNSNLINFQNSIVTTSSDGIRRFDDLGNNTGRCYLTCHGKNHNPLSY